MTTKRALALAAAAPFLICLVAVWRSGGETFSDSETAVANVARLKAGMTMQGAIETLHPERTRRTSMRSYSTHSEGGGPQQMVHAIAPDRYVVFSFGSPGRRSGAYGQPVLKSWQVREGGAPREDVIIGRAVKVGRFTLRY